MSRGIVIALLLSLGVNVFLGGFVVGRMFNDPRSGMPPPPVAGFHHPGRFFGERSDLKPETREIIRNAYEARRVTFRAERTEARRLRDAFFETLAADPWDRAGVEAALVEQRAFEFDRKIGSFRLMIDILEQLPPEERAAFVKRAQERSNRWRGQVGKRGAHRRHQRREE